MAETSLEAATRSLGARTDPVFELFDYLKDVLFWIKDKKGIFRWVNTTLMLHIGRSSRDQIIGRTDFDLFEPYLANQYQMDDAQVLRGRPITSRVEMIVFNHTPRWIVTSKLPVRNASGRIVGTAGVATIAVREDRRSGLNLGWRRRWPSSRSTITSRSAFERWPRRCGLSIGSFHRQFRDIYLCTPHTYVRQLRVRMSCHALVFSRRPIAAVAPNADSRTRATSPRSSAASWAKPHAVTAADTATRHSH